MKFNETLVRDKIAQTFKEHPRVLDLLIEHDAMLAGGSLLDLHKNTTPKDYDIFFNTSKPRVKAVSNLLDLSKINTVSCNAANMYLQSKNDVIKLQLIDFKYCKDTHVKTLNSFDFKICRVGFNFANAAFIYGNGFEESFDSNNIEIDVSSDNLTFFTLKRIFSYQQKGYTITNENLAQYYMKMNNIKTVKEYKTHFNSMSANTADVSLCDFANRTEAVLRAKDEAKRKLLSLAVKNG